MTGAGTIDRTAAMPPRVADLLRRIGLAGAAAAGGVGLPPGLPQRGTDDDNRAGARRHGAPVAARPRSVGTCVRRAAGRVPACLPLAGPVHCARAVDHSDRVRLHRVRRRRRQTSDHRCRSHGRRGVRGARRDRRNWIALAARARLRRSRGQGLLAGTHPLRRQHQMVAPFCVAVDWLVAVILIVEIAAGVNFHY